MATIAPAASRQPTPRPDLPLWGRLLLWTVRLVSVFLIIKVVKNPWPLLRSRVFPSLVLWIVFSVYWAIAGRNSAPNKSSESKASTWFHQIVLVLALLLLFIPVPGLRGWFLPQRLDFLVAAGAMIQAAFGLLAIWARRHLGRNWSGAVRIGVDHELIRTGPYRFLRHPIYTAMLGMFLGTAISSSQYHALLGLAMMLAYVRKTRREEDILQQTFGAAYDDYRRDTWGLVPFLF
jgi:protein-S-isoprenylcysteine O-methyltransferase Ste14